MFGRILSLFLLYVLLPGQIWASPIYVVKQSDGSIKFTTKKPASGNDYKIYTSKTSTFSTYKSSRASYSISPKRFAAYRKNYKHNHYDELIEQAAVRYGLSNGLIKAVIHVESAFNPFAVSPKGAQGLMQIMPFNAKKFGMKNPFSPKENIFAGSKFLSKLVDKYAGNVSLALAAYNAGEGAVEKYNGIPPYTETINYVKKVLKFKQVYTSV